MKAIVQTGYGEPERVLRLEEVERPQVGADGVLIRRDEPPALAALLGSGDVRVIIDEIYALERAPAAVAHMLGHHARGKVVITV